MIGQYFPALLVPLLTTSCRASEDGGSVTPRVESQYPTAQDRSLPAITTARPSHIPDHHELYKEQVWMDSRDQNLAGGSRSWSQDLRVKASDVGISSERTIAATRLETTKALKDQASDGIEGSRTVDRTMKSPVSCQISLTAQQGFINASSQSSLLSSANCSYKISAYMGFGVEVQVMSVNLAKGDHVIFEEIGLREKLVLANESILMRGLVVRSHGNQIYIHFYSSRNQSGSLLLRYQAFVLSCVFPPRPLHGDVSVSSLHSGGQAFFSCLTGYKLQGSVVLTCRNASTPYWSGKEPQCIAACGGLIRNVDVGRIVSPGFPHNYSNNLTCLWLLEAPEGHRVHVHFEKVSLAEDDDRLVIRNGNSIKDSALFDSYEVQYLPNEGLISSSRYLLIELITDASGTSTGVALRYQAFASGHCYQPFVKFGNLSSSDLTWAVGTVVEFTCDLGYTLEHGPVTIECIDPDNAQWNETEPACRAVCSGEITDAAGVVLSPNWPEAYDKGQDCIWGIHVEEDKRIMLEITVLNVGKNDLLTFYDGDDLSAKVLGHYSGSKPGFKLYTSTADVTVQFQSDPATNIHGYGNGFILHFSGVDRNDTCPELPEISNGWKSPSHPDLVQGTVVTYQCYPGYQLVGPELLICQWDLTWTGDLPTCDRVVSCSDPGKVEHGRRFLSGPHFTVGSTIQYMCDKGFSLVGNSLLSCFNAGSSGPKWSQKLPRCLQDSFQPCTHPGTPVHGVASSNKIHFQAGETLHFSCASGRRLLGRTSLHCVPGHPSVWNDRPPACEASAGASDLRLDLVFVAALILILVVITFTGIYLFYSRVRSNKVPYKSVSADSTCDNSVYVTKSQLKNTRDRGQYDVSV